MLDENDLLFLYVNDNGPAIYLLSRDENTKDKYKELVKEHKDDPYETEGYVIWWSYEGWNVDREWCNEFEGEE
jgi:hypothetical protein